jgi:hypothetical protein
MCFQATQYYQQNQVKVQNYYAKDYVTLASDNALELFLL